MNLRWKKVWRDLWTNKGRTIVVVLAIAVGVIAFSSVFTSRAVLLADMSTQYIAIKPSSLTIYIPTGYEPELLRWIENHQGVEGVRGSAGTMVRLYTSQGSRNLELTALDDYSNSRINLISPREGTWPPERRKIVLERSSAAILPYSIGEYINVETPEGKKKDLEFSGKVHDLRAIPATLFPQLTGYITFDTMRYLGVNDALTRIEIRTDSSYKTQEDVLTLGNKIKKELENRGFTDVSVQAEKPNKHWGEDPTNAFVTILVVVGSFSLILSIFLVYNTISALIAQQKKQVGIMKAIGGRKYQIIAIYLATAAAYGIIALIIALPLGALLGYGNLVLVTNFLNLDITHFTIPIPVLVMIVLSSLGIPVLAALIPVLIGSRITVREAISDFSVVKQGHTFIDKIVNRLMIFSRPVTISLRNTFRQKSRLSMTLITLTIAGTLFISVISVRSSMLLELDKLMGLYNYDLELYFDNKVDANKAVSDAYKSVDVVQAEAPYMLSAEWVKETTENKEFLNVFGLAPDSRFMTPALMAGRWLTYGDTNQIVISNKFIRDNPELGIGRTISLKINDHKYNFEIAGIFLLPDAKWIIINKNYLKKIAPESDQVNSIRIQTANHLPDFLNNFAKNFEEQMKHRGYSIAYSLTVHTIRSSNEGQFNFLIGFLLMMAALVAVVGGLGLAGTMSLNVLERTREIGVMRSIGASNSTVFRLVLVESLFIGMLSWLIAIPLSVPMGIGFCYALGQAFFQKPLTFVFSISGIMIWLALIFIISVIASITPARKAVSLTVKDTLSYE